MDRFGRTEQSMPARWRGEKNVVVRPNLHSDNKLFMQGAAPSDNCKNAVWNAIKAANRLRRQTLISRSIRVATTGAAARHQTYQ